MCLVMCFDYVLWLYVLIMCVVMCFDYVFGDVF